MPYLSKSKYEKKLRKVQKRNTSYRRKTALAEAKEYKIKLPSTSKVVLAVVAFLCVEIVIFCEYVMLKTGDSSALYALIGVPATLVPTVIAYYSKSAKENTVGGIVYDTALANDEAVG